MNRSNGSFDLGPGSRPTYAAQPGSFEERPQERVSFHDIWAILRRNLGMILLILAVGMTAGAFVTLNLDKTYRAQSTIVLKVSDARVTQTDAEIEAVELTRASVETEIDVLRSREFAGRVASVLDLYTDPAFNPLARPGMTEADVTAAERETVISKLLTTYSVYRSGDSLALDILVEYGEPVMTARIANTVASEYISNSLDLKMFDVEQSINFLRNRTKTLADVLALNEARVAGFIRENNLDDTAAADGLRAQLERVTALYDLAVAGQTAGQDPEVLRAQITELERQLRSRTQAELELLKLERALETDRNRYQTAVEKLSEIEAQADILSAGARQVSFAEVPQKPAAPNVRTALAFIFVGLLGLSFVAVLLREGLDRRIWTEVHSGRVTGVPNLAYVPRVGRGGRRGPVPHQFLVDNPRSAFSESLRSLFTLCMNLGTRDRSQVIMITSGLPNEGKSTIAVSLGVSAAADHPKVLLIDLDVHRSGVSNLLKVGLSDVSIGEVMQDPELLAENISPVEELPGLFLLNFRKDSEISGQLMTGQKAARSIRWMRENFDVIIFDTPPVLIVDDASRLAPITDEALLIARWGVTTEEVLRDTAERLKRNGVQLTGTVINDVDIRRQKRYGYGGYASYYAYGGDYY
ncbi:GumC family protein [Oceanomicrobium pacificus]|uniref:AAA family ATPase n=1 Tax=Oceanomicrobium pacificus TaxID=2692916 RepID=A0A6B0TU84_9RHOB|nr:AAA family ATPase [Oceanomicrobium pacificus]MXU65208.1 AAA family ATPase [Oceanomicrobium pacificus]